MWNLILLHVTSKKNILNLPFSDTLSNTIKLLPSQVTPVFLILYKLMQVNALEMFHVAGGTYYVHS